MVGPLCILGVWVVLGACLCGVGLSLRRLAGFRGLLRQGLFFAFWLGFAGVVGFLQLWHLVLPVAPGALVVVLAVGLSGLVWNQRNLRRWLRATRLGGWLLCLGLSLFTAHKATGPWEELYDTGLYHWNAVRFAADYPAIPGLANLHLRLGFNNSGQLWSAMLEAGPLRQHCNHFSNGLLYLTLLLAALAEARRGLRRGRLDVHGAFLMVAGSLAVADILSGAQLCCLGNDCQAALAVLAASAALLRLGRRSRRRGLDAWLLTTGTLLTLALCLKLSTAFFVAAGWVLTLGFWGRARQAGQGRGKVLLGMAIVVAFLLPGWLARGIILSGYPLFPTTIAGLPVDWRVPAERVRESAGAIEVWARWAGRPPGDAGRWDWLEGWSERFITERLDQDAVLPILLALFCLLIAPWAGKGRCRERLSLLASLVPPGLALLGWFLTAPDPRFATGPAWALAGMSVALLIDGQGGGRSAVWAVLVLVLVAGFLNAVPGKLLVSPPPEGKLFHPTPRAELREFVTDSGLRLYVPVDDLAFDSPLPATPQPDRKLRLRVRDDLRQGFTLVPEKATPPP